MKLYVFTLSLLLIAACSETHGDVEPAKQSAAQEVKDEAHRVTLSAAAIHGADITTTTAGPGVVMDTLQVYGTTQPLPERVREVTARYPGVIRSVAHGIGDVVRSGEVLATVESNDSLQTYPVTAPISGVIAQRRANPGEVAGEKALFSIVDYSQVAVEFNVFSRDRLQIKINQIVKISDADNRQHATARIVYIAPLGNAANQTVIARAVLSNANHQWVPGQFVNGEIATAESRVAIAVEASALQQIKGKDLVFVQDKDGFEVRDVTLGRRNAEFVEVLQGVAAGESYVNKNSYVIKAEALKSEAEED